jgi:glycosyltransferase involved in cell wall biosynthesis
MMRKKVLFIPSWYPSEFHPVSGVFIKEHAKAASIYNDVVVLYVYRVPWRQIFPRLFSVYDNVEDGLRTVRVRYTSLIPKTGLITYLLVTLYTFLRLRKDFEPDLIHAHVVLLSGLAALCLKKLFGIPFVLSEHTAPFSLQMQNAFHKHLVRRIMQNAAAILPVTTDLKHQIMQYGIDGKFEIVPNTVDITLFSAGANEETACDTTKILLVALLGPQKGIPFLLKAIALLKEEGLSNFVLDIVGDGPHRVEYEELTCQLNVQDIVRFHGLKSKQELAAFMRRCDFFVLPSLWENLPCVLIEAMACGKPVLASRVGGIPEIITDEVGILTEPGDVGSLAQSLEWMLRNYPRFDPARIAQYAQERFSYLAVGKRLDEIYSRTLVQGA